MTGYVLTDIANSYVDLTARERTHRKQSVVFRQHKHAEE